MALDDELADIDERLKRSGSEISVDVFREMVSVYTSNPDVAAAIAKGIANELKYTPEKAEGYVTQFAGTSDETRSYIRETCDALDAAVFEPHTFWEFIDHYAENPEQAAGISALVVSEREFVNQQDSTYAFPFVMTLSGLDEAHQEKLKGLEQDDMYHIGLAYDIARKNSGEDGADMLPMFYAELKKTLDDEPGKVGSWGMSITQGFLDDEVVE